jgi:hypothetical protein
LAGVLAIDPGCRGGIAKIERDVFWALPLTGKPDHDLGAVRELLRPGDKVYLEQVHAIHGTSSGSNFAFGKNVGFIEGILWASGIEALHYIAPKVWQKAIGVTGIKESRDRKLALIARAREIYPGLDLRRTKRCTSPDSGMHDALLMAYVATHMLLPY